MPRKKRKTNSASETLRQAVLDSGQSLTEVANATGIDLGNLSRFVRGRRWLSQENIDVLCDHLGLVLVRPGATGKLRRGAARLVLGAAIATAAADPSPVNDALAALIAVGHTRTEATLLIDKATSAGRQFATAGEILSAIYSRHVMPSPKSLF